MSALEYLAGLEQWAADQGRTPTPHSYGPDPDQVADLLLPEAGGDGPSPVAVLLHGGFWRASFTKAVMNAMAVDLADRGWGSWNVEYRRTGTGGGVPETLDDVRQAITALENVDAPLDHRQTMVIGHSAGGHLALCCAGPPPVSRVVVIAGVCDLLAAAHDRLGDDAVVDFIGGGPVEKIEAYAAADPITLLPTGGDVLLVHGDADDRVPISQSRAYQAAASSAGDACELLELPGVDHFAVIDPRTAAWQTIAERLPAIR